MTSKFMCAVGVGLVFSAAVSAQFENSKRGGQAGSRFVQELEPMPAVTFADKSGVTYIPARSAAELFSHHIEYDRETQMLTIGDEKLKCEKTLFNGRTLIPLRELQQMGATIDNSTEPGKIVVETANGNFEVNVGRKFIEVDQSTQRLVGYQGDMVVIDTKVSTGGRGHHTPNGDFKTGPYKARMHYSKLYNNAPMPYSIQVNGNVFIHGYGSVPNYPASHGCIRVPLGKKNPAKYLYSWAEKGVDVRIHGAWKGRKRG